jgi:hypothetical protein
MQTMDNRKIFLVECLDGHKRALRAELLVCNRALYSMQASGIFQGRECGCGHAQMCDSVHLRQGAPQWGSLRAGPALSFVARKRRGGEEDVTPPRKRRSRPCILCADDGMAAEDTFACSEHHTVCNECFSRYITETWFERRMDYNDTQPELRCCINSCRSQPLTETQVARHANDAALTSRRGRSTETQRCMVMP